MLSLCLCIIVIVLSLPAAARNLVAEVSIPAPVTYTPAGACGRLIKIVAVHCGMKNNIIRHFIKLGVELKVVPWDYDFTNEDYDGMCVTDNSACFVCKYVYTHTQ